METTCGAIENMRFDNIIIGKPKNFLIELLTQLDSFEESSLIYALQQKRFSSSEIELLAAEVAEFSLKLTKQEICLKQAAEKFNKQFANKDNKYFDTIRTMLMKVRSGVSETRRIYKKFCPIVRRQHPLGYTPSAFNHSYISTSSYLPDLFGINTCPDCVQGLYREMKRFFDMMASCLRICKRVLDEEAEIKKNGEYCLYLFEKFKQELFDTIGDLCDIITEDSLETVMKENKAVREWLRMGNTSAYAKEAFHNISITDCKYITIVEQTMSTLQPLEQKLFGKDVASANRMRQIAMNMDEFLPENYKKKYIPIENSMAFYDMFNKDGIDMKPIIKYLKHNYEGKYMIHSYTTINSRYGHTDKNELVNNLNDFEARVNEKYPREEENLHENIHRPMTLTNFNNRISV